jgi:heme oxygenase
VPRHGTPLLDRLRRDTRALHAQVESAVPILRRDAGAAEYRTYLTALLRFHRPLEAALASVEGLHHLPLDLSGRWKTPYLDADLEALGMSVDERRRAADAHVPTTLGDVPSALGCMYVLEGATLGGQFVHRQLKARMPGVIDGASRYLQCYGPATAARWRTFCAVLDDRAADADAIVEGAVATFQSFRRCIGA